MTLAFEIFMRQCNLSSSEKADGYSRDAFFGLDVHEKEAVFKLLLTELPWSAEWLFLLDSKKASVAVKEREEKLRGNPYEDVFMLQEQIVKYSGDLLYQKHMIEDYFSYMDSSKPLVVDSIARTPTNEETLSFFKQIIMVETNGSAVARASRHFLDAMRFPCDTDEDERIYSRLVNALRSESVQRKQKAIAEVEKFSGASSRNVQP